MKARAKDEVRNFETIFKTKRVREFPLRSPHQLSTTMMERSRAPSALRKTYASSGGENQLATLCEFAIGLSHEINNSLEVLVNQVEMLRNMLDGSPPTKTMSSKRSALSALRLR